MLDLAEPMSQRLITQATGQWGPMNWILRSEAKLLRLREVEAANAADLTLVADDIDLQLMAKRAQRAKLWSVANGAFHGPGFGRFQARPA